MLRATAMVGFHPLTLLSSSRVELRCLLFGFFTNSFSHEAWSSFSMLFPALITLWVRESDSDALTVERFKLCDVRKQ